METETTIAESDLDCDPLGGFIRLARCAKVLSQTLERVHHRQNGPRVVK